MKNISNNFSNDHSKCSVPSTALYTDYKKRYYVLIVKEQQGPWGKEYICKQKFVMVLEKKLKYAILKGKLEYPIVIDSDKPISDGNIVKLH